LATTLLLTGEDITKNTIINGNVDKSKYQSDIKTCQNLMIKPLLGEELYNKICSDYEDTLNGTGTGLTGSYYMMYEDYIKEMVIHGSTEIYLNHAAYTVSNSGVSKLVSQNGATSVNKDEIDFLIQSSRKLYNLYKDEFLKWIDTVSISEWNGCITPSSKKRNYGGWRL